MKNLFLFLLPFIFILGKSQTIHDNYGNQICYVQDNSFYTNGEKIGFIQQGYANIEVFRNSGKVGFIQGNNYYDNYGNQICYIQDNSFYRNGKKIGFVSQNIIYDGAGNRLGSARGLSILHIAVFFLYFN